MERETTTAERTIAAAQRLLHRDTDDYPAPLRDRLASRSPPVLYVIGTLAASPSVAVVGTRAASAQKVRAATELGQALAAAGYSVVSGGALGIDAAAHRGALRAARRAPGCTVAVLGSGLDRLYPPGNRRLFAEIVAAGGALVTPFALGQPPRRGHFPRRNELIAGWADAVVVVEAGARSGALNTVRHARALGVQVMVYPGSAAAALRSAVLVRGARDVIDLLAEGKRPCLPRLDDPDQRLVLEALIGLAQAAAIGVGAPAAFLAQDVAREAGLRLPRTAAALVRLQISGHVQVEPGGRFLARCAATSE